MVPRQPRRYFKTLASLSRIRLLHELQSAGPRELAPLADAVGLHPNSAREHLHLLVDSGLVEARPLLRGARGRPRLRYAATHRTAPHPRPDGPALDVVGDHLIQCGFEVTVDRQAVRLTVQQCPYAVWAADEPVVCDVHATLVRDALAQAHVASSEIDSVRFAVPRECPARACARTCVGSANTTGCGDLPCLIPDVVPES